MYRGRFAPSPTGQLHFGSLVAAIGSYLRARAQNGIWIVRMEDLDPLREVPGAAKDILETLAAFGMVSDEPVLYQSTRNAAYAAAFERLRQDNSVFPCWCSRSELSAAEGIHRGRCSTPHQPSTDPAWRLNVEAETIEFTDLLYGKQIQRIQTEVGDFVLKRTEGYYAYQLAVVVDDEAQKISEIVRGADLLDSTARQIYLQRKLGYRTPAYLHLPLALDAEGKKLSKQDRSRPVDKKDPLPSLKVALRFLGLMPSHSTKVNTILEQAIADFDLQELPRSSTGFVSKTGSSSVGLG